LSRRAKSWRHLKIRGGARLDFKREGEVIALFKMALNKTQTVVRVLLVLSFLVEATARADSPRIWIGNDGGWSRDYVTNGKVKVGRNCYGAYDISDLVKDNPTALDLVHQQNTYFQYATVSFFGGEMPALGGLVYGAYVGNKSVTAIGAAGVFVMAVVTGYFMNESRHYMLEAVNTYNGVGIEPPARSSGASLESASATSLAWSVHF
jgi:hypothetical protein